MTLKEFNDKMSKAVADYRRDRRRLYTAIAMDALAVIKKRVQDNGERPEGGSYDPYSTNPLPAWYYLGKSRGELMAGSGKTYTRSGYSAPFKKMVAQQARAGKGFYGQGWSYKEWRDANNLQTAHKDFSFTGKMWKNIKVKVSTSATVIHYDIAPTGADEVKKLQYNEAKSGAILAMSRGEIVKAEDRAQEILTSYFTSRL